MSYIRKATREAVDRQLECRRDEMAAHATVLVGDVALIGRKPEPEFKPKRQEPRVSFLEQALSRADDAVAA